MTPLLMEESDVPIKINYRVSRRLFNRLAPYLKRALDEDFEMCPAELGLSAKTVVNYSNSVRLAYIRFHYKNEWLKVADIPALRAIKVRALANGNVAFDKNDGRLTWRLRRHQEETYTHAGGIEASRPTRDGGVLERVTVSWEIEADRNAALERAQREPGWADAVSLSFLSNTSTALAELQKLWPLSVLHGNRIVVVTQAV